MTLKFHKLYYYVLGNNWLVKYDKKNNELLLGLDNDYWLSINGWDQK